MVNHVKQGDLDLTQLRMANAQCSFLTQTLNAPLIPTTNVNWTPNAKEPNSHVALNSVALPARQE